MTLTVPTEGELAQLAVLLAGNLYIGLYKNNLAISKATIFANLTQATFTGYAEQTLTGGAWVTTGSAPSVATYAAVTFLCSAAGTPETEYGYYIRDGSNKLWAVEAFPTARLISAAGASIPVNPRITLADSSGT